MIEYPKLIDDLNNDHTVAAYDELSLWAAPFGLVLLDAVKYRHAMKVLDVGCGVGFPLLEIAQRLGRSSQIYGIDPWENAVRRTKLKIDAYDLKNAYCLLGKAEELPFDNCCFDLVVSNNGINNVQNIPAALRECCRVCRDDGQMVLTANLPDTMKEFYELYRQTLRDVAKTNETESLDLHIRKKRKSVQEMTDMIRHAGFPHVEVVEDSFALKFTDGTAMLDHHFIRQWFLGPWIEIIGHTEANKVFNRLEEKLNQRAQALGELMMTVPYACFDCRKEPEIDRTLTS